RYRSDPRRLTSRVVESIDNRSAQSEASSLGSAERGPKVSVLPMLVSSNGRWRWLSQLSPVTEVTGASVLSVGATRVLTWAAKLHDAKTAVATRYRRYLGIVASTLPLLQST